MRRRPRPGPAPGGPGSVQRPAVGEGPRPSRSPGAACAADSAPQWTAGASARRLRAGDAKRGKRRRRSPDGTSSPASPAGRSPGSPDPSGCAATGEVGDPVARDRRTPGAWRPPERLLGADLDDEPMTTLPPPAVECLAAAAGGHARTESVLVLPLAVPRIVGRLHDLTGVLPGSSDSMPSLGRYPEPGDRVKPEGVPRRPRPVRQSVPLTPCAPRL